MAIDYTRTYFGWSSESPADWADPTSGLVIHYNGDATGLTTHAGCVSYWKGVRNSHVNGNGWADGGYSFGVSVGGDIFEMRGLHRYQAAQGTTAGNRDYYSVSLMIGGSEQPTPAQINGVRRLRAWLMAEHGMAGTVLGHRDFVSTSCPGTPLYQMVRDGTFTQPPGAHTGGNSPLIGLKEGDTGEGVIAVQRLISFSGERFAEMLEPYGCDGDWGSATTAALLAVRKSVGSSVSSSPRVTGTAYSHLIQAVARQEAREMIAASAGSGGGSLPATVTVSGQLEVQA